jgi:hypothetical protein
MYLRTSDNHGKHAVRLIIAKSRLAPLKVISLTKLELCAAVLLARLTKKILPSLNIKFSRRLFWSDSTIVLMDKCTSVQMENVRCSPCRGNSTGYGSKRMEARQIQ